MPGGSLVLTDAYDRYRVDDVLYWQFFAKPSFFENSSSEQEKEDEACQYSMMAMLANHLAKQAETRPAYHMLSKEEQLMVPRLGVLQRYHHAKPPTEDRPRLTLKHVLLDQKRHEPSLFKHKKRERPLSKSKVNSLEQEQKRTTKRLKTE
jgi:hypothetical protein